MTSRSEDLTLAIKALEESVRGKYQDFKQSSIQFQKENEIKFKPLIQPLKDLREHITDVKKEIKIEPKEESENIQEYNTEEEELPLSETEYGSEDGSSRALSEFEESSSRSLPEFDLFIKSNKIGDLLGNYLRFLQNDNRNEADFTYGIHYDGVDWKLGSHPVSFSDNDIVINDVVYKGTPGLFELVFKKHPQNIFNESDLKSYKKMLESTNVHKKGDGNRIKANRGYKYTNIISNMFPPKMRLIRRPSLKRKAKTQLTVNQPSQPMSPFIDEKGKKQKTGEGLHLEVNKSPIHYKYWNDPNELVERLRILIASKHAGNTGHGNEVIAILEELKESGIIKDFSNFTL